MVEKHDTEHEVEGGAPKHSQVEGLSSSSHGGVIPQTRIAEAGSELLDDMPFEQMASPQKSGRHADGPTRPTIVNLLGCIRSVEALDIEPDVSLQCDDLECSHCLIDDGRMLIKYVSPQALGSAMQASLHVSEASVQKDARSL